MIDWLCIGLIGLGFLFTIARLSLIFEVPLIVSIIKKFLGIILFLIGGKIGYFGYKRVKLADG